MPVVLHRFYPSVALCPRCGCERYDRSPGARWNVGTLQRRLCLGCGSDYKIQPSGVEILDDGARVSRIVPPESLP